MNVDKTPEDLSTGSKEIPAGQAAVKVTAKPKLTNLIYNGDLVPYMVQRDFHRRVQKAIDELGMKKSKFCDMNIYTCSVLQIRRGNRDNLGIISHISP